MVDSGMGLRQQNMSFVIHVLFTIRRSGAWAWRAQEGTIDDPRSTHGLNLVY
jgi:hypothetical protein